MGRKQLCRLGKGLRIFCWTSAPANLLSSTNAESVCKWLCYFVLKTRQELGELYPSKLIYLIRCGLHWISHSKGVPFNFLDKSDSRFRDLHTTLDTVCSNLHTHARDRFHEEICTSDYHRGPGDDMEKVNYVVRKPLQASELCVFMLACTSPFVEVKSNMTSRLISLNVFQKRERSMTNTQTIDG